MKPSFTSIRFPIGIDPGYGRLSQEETYAQHVEQMIRQVLLTSPGERINRPDFGCGIKRMVFAPNSQVAAALVQVSIVEALNRWLASAIVVGEVKVEAREEILSIFIAYTLRVRQEKRFLNIEVSL